MPLTALEVEPALSAWDGLAGSSVQLINHSENKTFLVDAGVRGRYTLRLHRVGYQSKVSIQSELDWLTAIRRETDVPVAEPVPGRDGALIQAFGTAAGERLAVLFRFLPGGEPTPDSNLGNLFTTLGQYAARLHQHSAAWPRPATFNRPVWDASTILDADGPWGDWRVAPGVNAANRTILDRLDASLWRRLGEYGQHPDRYGLIHADMRLGNLLVHGDHVNLIDFDDCGFCWFVYDFAAAISFHETHKAVPALKAAWLDGYATVRTLSAEDVAAIDSMVMLRRMALLAWIGSHADTQLAQQHMPGFADGTAQLAERYLRGPLWR